MADDADDDVTRTGPTGTDPAGQVVAGDEGWLHGTWRLTHVDDAALADGLQGPPWLTFDGDGVVFGYAGVNRVRGTWRLEGDLLVLGPVVATLMAGPPEATATERAVLAVLSDGGTLVRDGDGFTVRTPAGRTAVLVPAPGQTHARGPAHDGAAPSAPGAPHTII